MTARTTTALLLSRADSLLASTLYGDSSAPGFEKFAVPALCSGTHCSWSLAGVSKSVSKEDFSIVDEPGDSVLTKHGITTVEWRAALDDMEAQAYGAWMNHSAFGVQAAQGSLSEEQKGFGLSFRFAIAGGNLTGSRPAISATWRGLMVGTPQSGTDKGERLQGDATLTFTAAATNTLEADFTGIVNLDDERPHTVRQAGFSNVPVSSAGTFSAGFTGNRIDGGIYGPGHVEAAGVFEQSGIVGAFGAFRE